MGTENSILCVFYLSAVVRVLDDDYYYLHTFAKFDENIFE